MNSTYKDVLAFAKKHSHPIVAVGAGRYFKSGKGEYGEGMQFLGLRAAQQKDLAAEFIDVRKSVRKELLSSKWHELKLIALRMLVLLYAQKNKQGSVEATKIYREYVSYFPYINNWDLVDVSSYKIVGPELLDSDRSVLYKWANSKNMWVRRISIVSTLHFIKRGDLTDCFALAEYLLDDSHDLMHKAVGWMLREVGKQNIEVEKHFILKNYTKMPRMMLRYAIEKFPDTERKKYLQGRI